MSHRSFRVAPDGSTFRGWPDHTGRLIAHESIRIAAVAHGGCF